MPRARYTTAAAHYKGGRSIYEWTPALLRSARFTAKGGSLWLAARAYTDLLGEDDRHHGTLASLAQSVLSLPLSFEADGDKRRLSRIERAALEDFAEMAPVAELISLVSWGVSLGVGLAQLRPWARGKSGRLLPRLQTWPLDCVRFDIERRVWLVDTDAGPVEVEQGTGEWILFLPYGGLDPWDKGTWRACAEWALLKREAKVLWGREAELSAGIRTAEVPDGASRVDRSRLADDLAEIGADGVVIPPYGYKLGIIQHAQTTFQTYREQIHAANAAIAVANKGESFTSGTDGQGGLGAGGVAGTHKDVSDERRNFLAGALAECLAAGLLSPWARVNFGGGAPVPVPCWQIEEEEDLETRGKAWKSAGDGLASLKAAGVPVDVRAAAEEIGLPLLSPEQERAEADKAREAFEERQEGQEGQKEDGEEDGEGEEQEGAEGAKEAPPDDPA